jgi:hypothetical protein
MRNWLATRVVFFCFVPMLLAGCGPGTPQEAIVGTWQTGLANKKRTMTFWENGVWTYEGGAFKYKGQYRFLADDRIEIKMDAPSGSGQQPTVFTRAISFSHHDKMNTTDVETLRRTTWTRVIES